MSEGQRAAFPHCDTRILHAPGECEYCDKYDDWQELRSLWGIAFTGHKPQETQHRKELPCPADFNRPPDTPADHRQWPGNTPEGYQFDLIADPTIPPSVVEVRTGKRRKRFRLL